VADVKKGRLGGASAALLGRRGAEALASLATAAEAGVTELTNAVEIDITKVSPDPQQPRKSLDPSALQELADSIAEKGILQPLVVRRQDDRFIIVAGERRYRAALLAGMERIPAMIREVASDEAVEQSLIENLQRENIEPIEESSSFRQLMQVHGYSMRDLAGRLHKSHAYVAERLQLTRHQDIAEAVASGAISAKAASELARVEEPNLRQSLLERVKRGDIDSRHIRQAKRGVPPSHRDTPGPPVPEEVDSTANTPPVGGPVLSTNDTSRVAGSLEPTSDDSLAARSPEAQPAQHDKTGKGDIIAVLSPETETEDAGSHATAGSHQTPLDRQAIGPTDSAHEKDSIALPPGSTPSLLEAIAIATQAIGSIDITVYRDDREVLREQLATLARSIELLLHDLT